LRTPCRTYAGASPAHSGPNHHPAARPPGARQPENGRHAPNIPARHYAGVSVPLDLGLAGGGAPGTWPQPGSGSRAASARQDQPARAACQTPPAHAPVPSKPNAKLTSLRLWVPLIYTAMRFVVRRLVEQAQHLSAASDLLTGTSGNLASGAEEMNGQATGVSSAGSELSLTVQQVAQATERNSMVEAFKTC
jgi:hypothetical protein